METNEIPKIKVGLPDLNNLPGYIQDNQDSIRLDASYNHLSPEQALTQMIGQAQKAATSFRELGKSDQEIQTLITGYLFGPVNNEPTSERK